MFRSPSHTRISNDLRHLQDLNNRTEHRINDDIDDDKKVLSCVVTVAAPMVPAVMVFFTFGFVAAGATAIIAFLLTMYLFFPAEINKMKNKVYGFFSSRGREGEPLPQEGAPPENRPEL